MPAGEPHTMLSPIEKAVLAKCEQWHTLEEIQQELFAEFHFDSISSALAFLRRRKLVETWTPGEPDLVEPRAVIYQQTGLGTLVLGSQLRKEAAADFLPERGLHVV